MITTLVRDALALAAVSANGSGSGTPIVGVSVTGRSTGGGGASYTVEVFVKATVPSPFAKNRSAEAVFWRGVASSDEGMRFDPASKGFIKPTGPINERVYASVREVAGRLASDLRRGNQAK
jgi:hypothetical protein